MKLNFITTAIVGGLFFSAIFFLSCTILIDLFVITLIPSWTLAYVFVVLWSIVTIGIAKLFEAKIKSH